MKRLFTSFLALVGFSAWSQTCDNNALLSNVEYYSPDDIEIIHNIKYGEAINSSNQKVILDVDIYRPKSSVDALAGVAKPTVLNIHGGGFARGNGDQESLRKESMALAQRGFVVFVNSYRLEPWVSISNKTMYRAQQDAQAALRFMVAHSSEYEINPDFIFLSGSSAGCITAFNVLYSSEEEWKVAEPSIVSDLGPLNTSGNNYTNEYRIRGMLNNWGAAFIDRMDPEEMVPTISFHANGDRSVRIGRSSIGYSGSESIHSELIDNDIPSALHVLDEDKHSVLRSTDQTAHRVAHAICFLKDVLCNGASSYRLEYKENDFESHPSSCYTPTASFAIEKRNYEIKENNPFVSEAPIIHGTPIGELSYSIVDRGDDSFFTIDKKTGIVAMAPKNFEKPLDAGSSPNSIYTIHIKATDEDHNSTTQQLSVKVINAAEITVNENEDFSEQIFTPEVGVSYSLSGEDSQWFTINENTAEIRMAAKNYESPVDANGDNAYEISILSSTGGKRERQFVVKDVQENTSFSILGDVSVPVNENEAYTSEAPSISGEAIGKVEYSIKDGSGDYQLFTINSETGAITLAAQSYENPIDKDNNNNYTIRIIATDEDGNSSEERRTVRIQNVEDDRSFSINDVLYASVKENETFSFEPPVISGDSAAGTLHYSLSGPDAGQFFVEPSTGIVSMSRKDYEEPKDSDTNNHYQFTISVIDEEGNIGEGNWSIRVTNAKERVNFSITGDVSVPHDEESAYVSEVPGLAGGTPMGEVTYYIKNGADSRYFSVNPANGVVSVPAMKFKNEDEIVGSDDNTYTVTLIAIDEDGNTAEARRTIRIQNIHIADFSIEGEISVPHHEGEPYESEAPSLSGDTPFGEVIYTLKNGRDVHHFDIDPTTGVIYMVPQVYKNAEEIIDGDDNIYTVRIVATDEEGNTAEERRTVRIQEREAEEDLSFYPNPASSSISLPSISEPTLIKIYDQSGTLLINQELSNSEESINVSSLPRGTYIISNGESVEQLLIE